MRSVEREQRAGPRRPRDIAGAPKAKREPHCSQSPNGLRRNLRVGLMLFALAATNGFDLAARAESLCTCRARDRSFELGQTVCLQTPNGPRMAVCVMVLNNTSWQISQTPCVGAGVQPAARDRPG